MPTVRIISRRPHADGTVRLYLVYLASRESRCELSTGLRVPAKAWRTSSQTVASSHPEASKLNAKLRGLVERVWRAVEAVEQQGHEPTADAVKQQLGMKASSTPSPNAATVRQALAAYTEHKRGQVRPVTLVNYHALAVAMGSHADLPCATFSLDALLTEWRAALLPSTITRHLANYKALARWAVPNGYPLPSAASVRVKEPPRAVPFTLSRAELQQLAAAPLPPSLDAARRAFLLQCYTGLAFTDLALLKPEHIVDGCIVGRRSKSGQPFTVPLTPEALALLSDTRDLGSRQGYTKQLKKALRAAGLTRAVEVERAYADRVERTTVPAWQAVATHTARRTFATLELERGTPLDVLRAMMGHATLNQVLAYQHLDRTRLKLAVLGA
jgi:integrase